MTVANIHQNSFAMIVERQVKFLVTHALLLFSIQNLFYFQRQIIFLKLFTLFLQIHETPYPSFPSLSSKRDHEEMEQGDDEVK